jgi:hypothetical protein
VSNVIASSSHASRLGRTVSLTSLVVLVLSSSAVIISSWAPALGAAFVFGLTQLSGP